MSDLLLASPSLLRLFPPSAFVYWSVTPIRNVNSRPDMQAGERARTRGPTDRVTYGMCS